MRIITGTARGTKLVTLEGEATRPTIDKVKEAIKNQPGLVLYDDVKNHIYPNSLVATDNDKVYVGRIRRDISTKNGILMYCVADNIRKGAASNAVQIAMALDIDKCKK